VNIFKRKKILPPSYRPPLEAAEVIQLFTQLTLHQQAALLRLISRNLTIKLKDETFMGYEFDFNVDGAVISAEQHEEELE
jgi:hypothetical protein